MRPALVVTLGNTALQALAGDTVIGSCHGRLLSLPDVDLPPLFPLYHPASIIYNRSLKDVYYADLAVLKQLLEA